MKLPLFDSEVVEKEFELSFDSKTKEQFGHELVSRSVYIRRGQKDKVDKGFQIPNKKDYTFIRISGLNFLGQYGGIDFRFITDDDGLPCNNDVLLPSLNELSRERLIEFAENVIQRIINKEFEWDYVHRRKVYNLSQLSLISFNQKNQINMKIVQDFFNKTASEIDKKFFPDVKYYRDNKKTTEVHYALELFNNGCLTYSKLIQRLSKACGDTKENIHRIVSKYIEDFDGFEYKPN